MTQFLKHLLTLYKEKQVNQEIALSLIDEYKKSHQGERKNGDASGISHKFAVVGVSLRMPHANTVGEFWTLLKEGKDCIRAFPESRRKDTDPIVKNMDPKKFHQQDNYFKGSFLDEIDKFDNEFFGFLPAEAQVMDPQQRVFLELAYEAFQDAGYTKAQLRHTNTGVFLGDVINEYRKIIPRVTSSAVVGNISPFISSRVSFFYNLHGPAINVSTTCSTSLVAVHAACQALLQKECDLALVGAINLRLFPFALKDDPVDALGITSQDSCCRAFDNKANGVVRGEGGGVIVLKPLNQALADKDHIYATLLGSAVNNDGQSSSVGAPNPLAQEKLLKTAWERSQIDPKTILYIETHGTGTKIGDPIEIEGITKAFSSFTKSKQFCRLGSVKTNVGHLTGGASGIVGLIKTVLALKNQEIPPTLHFETPNELVDFTQTPVYVGDRLTRWPSSIEPKRAAVSAFGFNGTNCHIVLEEAPVVSLQSHQGPHLFVVSHRSEAGLRSMLNTLYKYLNAGNFDDQFGNICYTLAVGRDHFQKRLAIIGSNVKDLLSKILLLKDVSLANKIVTIEGSILDAHAIKLNHPSPLVTAAVEYCLHEVSWHSLFDKSYSKISLPTYQFEKKRFWIEGHFYQDEESQNSEKNTKQIDLKVEERTFLDVVQQVMGLDKIKDSDNFFELGGDSLLAIQLINELHKAFGKKITYNDLFTYPKMAELAALIEKKSSEAYREIEVLPIQKEYKLSFGQRRLWILHQMQDNPIAYNIYDAHQFEGNLQLEAFQTALDLLSQRHDSFRTTFHNHNGEIFQRVHSNQKFPLDFKDLRNEQDPEKTATEQMEALKKTPFDLQNGPLAKALLVQITSYRYLLFFSMHHIISDGWSIRLIIQDLLSFYHSLSEQKKIDVAPLKVRYIDYAEWQQKILSHDRFQQLKQYWLNKLSGTLPICEIAGDKPRPIVFHFEGSRKVFDIPDGIHTTLNELALKQNATLFMSLLSSLYIFLYRYSGQGDLIVGTPVAGRSHFDLKNIVGFFVNTLALRSTLQPDESFNQVLEKIRLNVLEAFEHQDYPFDHLVDQLKLERDTSRSPIFNVNIAFQNFETNAETQKIMSALKVRPYPLHHHSCKWDLEFEFIKRNDGSLYCSLEYYTGVYSEKMIEILIGNFLSLLESITKNPHLPLADLELAFTSANLLAEDAQLSTPRSTDCLHHIFERQVTKTPNAIAIKYENSEISYHELNERANQLACFLKYIKRLSKEERVGILMENSPETLVAILAILKAGGAYVPLDVKAPLERLRTIAKEAELRVIISKKSYINIVNDLQWNSSVDSYICLDSHDVFNEREVQSSSLANQELWNQVAEEGSDEISMSGWVSSYTGLPFTSEEMKEYKANVWQKMSPYLHKNSHVFEIGCGSGLTAFTLAPQVSEYIATDLSASILRKNEQKALEIGLKTIKFIPSTADQIDQLQHTANYNSIICNSVIHCFPGLNYLRKVIEKAINLCAENAVIFLGDLMDQDLKVSLERSMYEFKKSHIASNYRTKTDWSRELFVSRRFLIDLQNDFPAICKIEFSHKKHTISNELTEFRFDAILHIDKKAKKTPSAFKYKQQHDLNDLAQLPKSNLNLSISETSLAYVLFTSGSTGIPKGVMVEHSTVKTYIDWALKTYFQNELPRFPFYSPLSFDLTVTSIFCPLFTGSFLRVFTGEFDEVLNGLQKFDDCNVVKLTPSHLSMIVEGGRSLSSIRKFIVGGEALYASVVNALHNLYKAPISIYNEYGPTEATVGCIVYESKEMCLDQIQVPIGFPMSHVCIHILNNSLKPVPLGSAGEIFIAGHCLARGYLNNQLLTEEKFLANFGLGNSKYMYRTGDLGRCLPNGVIEYLGRNDRQVKVKGYRIELNEIEAVLVRHPAIKAVAVAVKEGVNGKVLCAYYCEQAAVTFAEVREFLLKELPEYMVPSFFMPMDKLPFSVNGKVDYLKLPAPVLEMRRNILTPETPTQELLLGIWSDVLGIPANEISIDHDFFELGGDSIIAMRILPKVAIKDILLSIKEIFQFRTIAALSAHITNKEGNTSIPVAQGLESGEVPLTPVQKWFFEYNMPHPAYFNMAYLFKVPTDIHEQLLEGAIQMCTEHHDMLRARFVNKSNRLQQEISAPNDKLCLEKIDLSGMSEQEIRAQIPLLSEKMQSQMTFEDHFLIKAIIFNLGKQGKRLLLILHHLIVDGVSWRYLIEDIEFLYQTKLNKPLPKKTVSYRTWALQLSEKAKKGCDLHYWEQIDPQQLQSIAQKKERHSIVANATEHLLFFDAAATQALLTMPQKLYSATVNEFLLAAFFYSLCEIFSIEQILLNHESHGRNAIDDLNVMRTVGWFTSIYPIFLKKRQDFKTTLKDVQTTLKELANKDFNYGVGRFLQQNSHLKKLNPEVLFNYFGRVGADLLNEKKLLSNCPESVGRLSDCSNPMTHLLEVNAIIMEDQLQLGIVYDSTAFYPSTINEWMNLYQKMIKELL